MVCREQSGSCEMMTSTSTAGSSSRAARRRRMEFRRVTIDQPAGKRRRFEDFGGEEVGHRRSGGELPPSHVAVMDGNNTVSSSSDLPSSPPSPSLNIRSPPHAREGHVTVVPKYGFASVCGRRRDMEDAVAIHPWFCRSSGEEGDGEGDDDVALPPDRAALHYFGVYDGHGCSHVATKCRERLHDVVKEEITISDDENVGNNWKCVMERSFTRMDKEVIAACNKNNISSSVNEEDTVVSCRCELQSPECDAVGSTAVVAVLTPETIVVANCGDSRAVLCRNGRPVPLSIDHKPDRADELSRIQAAGGRVIYWEGARVLGVLAMSRAIGDNYLKPYVSCEPEVTITDRTVQDEFLILASDGLWDVVSNDTACGVVRSCLRGPPCSNNNNDGEEAAEEHRRSLACNDASVLLTKLALARRSADNVSVVVVDLRMRRKNENNATTSTN